MKYLNTVLLLYMQVTLFVWLNAKIEKISTKDKFENYGFFCTILYNSTESGRTIAQTKR